MIISVPKEIFPGETRVAMTPETVRAFAEKGIGVRIEKGAGKLSDIHLLNRIASNIAGHTVCALGDAAATPVKSFIHHFKEEFVHHIEHKCCPFEA